MKLQAFIIGLGVTLALGAGRPASAAIVSGATLPAIEDGEQSRETELYESARQAIDEEQWRKAIDRFGRVVEMKGAKIGNSQ